MQFLQIRTKMADDHFHIKVLTLTKTCSDLVGAWWNIWHWAEEPKVVLLKEYLKCLAFILLCFLFSSPMKKCNFVSHVLLISDRILFLVLKGLVASAHSAPDTIRYLADAFPRTTYWPIEPSRRQHISDDVTMTWPMPAATAIDCMNKMAAKCQAFGALGSYFYWWFNTWWLGTHDVNET